MLTSFPVAVLVGTALGFLSGLGIGGGSLLMVWLTVVLGTDPATARVINLLFFLPSAVVACLFRLKQKKMPVRSLLPAIIPGCAAAALFSWISTTVDMEVLKKIFGIILLATGGRELLYRKKEDRE